MLVHLSGEHVKKHEWVACMLGLMGSLLVAADGLMSGGGEGHGVHGAVAVGDEENVSMAFHSLFSPCCCAKDLHGLF
jgi:hypothetical protein